MAQQIHNYLALTFGELGKHIQFNTTLIHRIHMFEQTMWSSLADR
jgi:hypothetical protein